ncbi:hypothetical protein KM915_20985 [Cytobacillus oceanisediminis]|uniref:hypothetical protein n=1 Tax=Cytobacillus oceanisediminis TaxID=665099 RepID=UPI001C22893A|nr:hypothetical protein [Cytobacillus oceanisediminis]MBU8732527.1 hypothetical protein [Cytobacillus oceanisediminis]
MRSELLIKENTGSELALLLEEKAGFSLVAFDEHSTEQAEDNTYYFFGGKDNKLYEIQLIDKDGIWLVRKREFKSSEPFEDDKTLN